MSPENFVKAQIAAYAYNEAAHCGGHDAMVAVACVLRNRVKAGWFGGDWMEVLNHAEEAAPLTSTIAPTIALSNSSFRRLLEEVDDIFLGMYTDTMTEGGLYYFDVLHAQTGRDIRPWFKQKILQDQANHPRKAQVGMLLILG